MNKKTVLLGAGALALLLSGTAMADPSVSQVREVGDVDWIDGTNLFKLSDSEGCYMADIDGNAVSGSGYASSFTYSNGYVEVYKDTGDTTNSEGLLGTDGSEVIPCSYGDIKIPNAHWALGYRLTLADANNYDYESWFSDDKFLIETVDVYHLDGNTAVLGNSFARENFLDYSADGDYIAIEDRSDSKITLYDSSFAVAAEDLSSLYSLPDGLVTDEYEIFSDNGQQGVKDADGNVIIEPAYKYVYDIEDGYVRVNTGDYYGLLDLQGNVIVPAEADELIFSYYGPAEDKNGSYSGAYVAGGYAAAAVDGKLAYYDLNGNQTVAPTLSKDLMEVNGASATYTDLEGNVHILAADGVDTVLDDAHKDIRALYYGSGFLYEFRNDNYESGLIDWHGNELLPMGQYSLDLSGDGSYLLAGVDYSNAVLYAVDYGIGASSVEADANAAADADAEEALVEDASSEEAAAA